MVRGLIDVELRETGEDQMAFKISKSILTAASTGIMLGAITACGGSTPPPETPAGTEAAPAGYDAPPAADAAAPAADAAAPAADATAAEGKACCKGLNECKGKGGCRAGEHSCKGQNECKGKGGCNAHCPK
jgi:hypothetical protein